jgi:hypothetical protein
MNSTPLQYSMVLSWIPDSGKSGMGMGMDPRSPANRGWGWGWTPDPRQIGDGMGMGLGGSVPCFHQWNNVSPILCCSSVKAWCIYAAVFVL